MYVAVCICGVPFSCKYLADVMVHVLKFNFPSSSSSPSLVHHDNHPHPILLSSESTLHHLDSNVERNSPFYVSIY